MLTRTQHPCAETFSAGLELWCLGGGHAWSKSKKRNWSVFRYPPFGPPENGHVPNARFEVLIRAYERENRRLEDGGKPGLLAGLFLLANRCGSAD